MSKKCTSCGRYGKDYVFSEDGFIRTMTLCVYCSSEKQIDIKAREFKIKKQQEMENGKAESVAR